MSFMNKINKITFFLNSQGRNINVVTGLGWLRETGMDQNAQSKLFIFSFIGGTIWKKITVFCVCFFKSL